MLAKWESLPEYMKTDTVKKYYVLLEKRRISLFAKRSFDIVCSTIMIVLFSPVLVLLAICVKVDSKGPALYRQVRITTGGKEFHIFKFRTMVLNADKIGTLVTVADDSRITKIGRTLRKYRLDELPQLFNVLIGEMSFVGTRPEVKKYVEKYADEMNATLLLPAGITSLASICYKDEDEIMDAYSKQGVDIDEAYINYVLKDKMKFNLEYLTSFGFWGDIILLIKTITKVFI